jgi:septum formation protein
MEPIILASGSLRRQEYFRLLGLPFSVMPSLIDEGQGNDMSAEDLAVKKVKKVMDTLKHRLPSWICGADTIISVDNDRYGKPADREEAAAMLRRLGGRGHEVITGLALFNGKTGDIARKTVSSTVRFSSLSEGEIEWYLNTGEGQGAAGAYRLQGLAGCFVSVIEGSYSGIVGLPLHEFYVMLRENGYPFGGN